jgi:hypothetical protein
MFREGYCMKCKTKKQRLYVECKECGAGFCTSCASPGYCPTCKKGYLTYCK